MQGGAPKTGRTIATLVKEILKKKNQIKGTKSISLQTSTLFIII